MNKPLRVLIVEDSEDDALLLMREFQRGGYEPVFERVATEESMIAAMKNQTLDLIIADYVLPHFSGLEALRVLQESGRDIPFIVVSGKISEDLAVEAMKAGACDYMSKNNLKRFLPAVQRELSEAKNRRQHRRTEEALLESEEHLREAQKMAHLGHWVWDIATGNVKWSEEVFRIFCLNPKEFTPHIDSILALSPWPEERNRDNELIQRAMKSHEMGTYEQRFIRPDKSIGYYISTFQGKYDDQNNLTAIVGTIQDITERKQAEEELKKSETMLKTVLAATPIGIALVVDRKFAWINDYMMRTIGRTSDELIGQSVRISYANDEEYNRVGELYYKQLKETGKAAIETKLQHKDGRVLDIFLTGVVLDQNDPSRGVVIGVMDITERKKSEEELKKSENMLKTVVDAVPVGIGLATNRKIIWVNDKFTQLLGRSQDELIGKDTRILYENNEEYNYLGNVLYKDIKEKRKAETEIKWQHKDGRILDIFLTGVSLDPMDISRGVILGALDITKRKQAEEEIRKALEAKSEFISVVSHELRTPLTVIKEGIALVFDEIVGKINDEQRELLDISKKNVDRLARLINNVLDIQKIDSGKMKFNLKTGDINEVVKEVYDTMGNSAKNAGLHFVLDLDTGLPKCSFERDKIIQVLTNLINNAIKFTDHGEVVIKTAKAQDAIQVSVSDTGCGIRKSDLPKVFDKFEQLETGGDRRTGGTGLGLAISKKIIEQHAGEIWVESTYEKGSKFIFTLPLQQPVKNAETQLKQGI